MPSPISHQVLVAGVELESVAAAAADSQIADLIVGPTRDEAIEAVVTGRLRSRAADVAEEGGLCIPRAGVASEAHHMPRQCAVNAVAGLPRY